MCFLALLELADSDRVQMLALGAPDIDGFIFEHRKIPKSSPSIFGVEDSAQLSRCAASRTAGFLKGLFSCLDYLRVQCFVALRHMRDGKTRFEFGAALGP